MDFYNSNVTLILGLITFALLGWMFYSLNKTYGNKDLDLGELMSLLAVDKSETIFVMVIIILFIAEGFTAASLHPKDDVNVPFSTITSHVCLAILGAVSTITAVRDIAAVTIKDVPLRYRIWRIAGLILGLFFAIWIPIITVGLIAAGLDKGFEYDVWLYSFNPFIDSVEYHGYLFKYGFPDNYQPYNSLPLMLKRSIWVTVFHMLALLWEGTRNMSSPKRTYMLMKKIKAELSMDFEKEDSKDDNEEDDKDKDKSKDTDSKHVLDNLKYILGFINYEKSKIDKVAQHASNYILSLKKDDDDQRVRFGVAIASLRSRIEHYHGMGDGNAKKKKKGELKSEVYQLFENDPKNSDLRKRGLGVPLKGKPGN